MSADLLRRAAAKLREHAEEATDGPWFAAPNRSVSAGKELVVASVAGRELWPSVDDALYIAQMHPPVALALAELLDRHAGQLVGLRPGAALSDEVAAMALAREILREPS